MRQTSRGLPSTCSSCGVDCVGQWYAEHDDAARAGKGFCASCAGVEQSTPAQPSVDEQERKRLADFAQKLHDEAIEDAERDAQPVEPETLDAVELDEQRARDAAVLVDNPQGGPNAINLGTGTSARRQPRKGRG